ncbi:MAG TPA: hypothetical protein VKB38_21435 [Terracidiphilus sp.]|nr:hypothetical protein [Terracidiphilus sp.]
MKAGTEDKKKVYVLVAMLAVILPAAIWELYGTFATPTQPPRAVATAPPRATSTGAANGGANLRTAANAGAAKASPEAERITNSGIDPTLHLDKLAQSEDVEYAGTGRNIFSAESMPVNIPQPVKSPRGSDQAQVVTPPPPAVPQPPAIDLKYFGYEQSKDKSIKAFIMHGDDIFMAYNGEVIDHRYRVGDISANSIQVTDLAYNNTQTLPLMQQ